MNNYGKQAKTMEQESIESMEVRDNVYKIDKNNYVKLIKEL